MKEINLHEITKDTNCAGILYIIVRNINFIQNIELIQNISLTCKPLNNTNIIDINIPELKNVNIENIHNYFNDKFIHIYMRKCLRETDIMRLFVDCIDSVRWAKPHILSYIENEYFGDKRRELIHFCRNISLGCDNVKEIYELFSENLTGYNELSLFLDKMYKLYIVSCYRISMYVQYLDINDLFQDKFIHIRSTDLIYENKWITSYIYNF